jgi:hypothetical protein
MTNRDRFDDRGELRDIFAALAMQALIKEAYGSGVTCKWVATQAYAYADMMLDTRDAVSHNDNNKETTINE